MMIHRASSLFLASLVACTAFPLGAQSLRMPVGPAAPLAATAGGTSTPGAAQTSADYIVAIVNTEPITNQQVRLEMQRVARQLSQAQRPVPDAGELAARVLEQLIVDRAQLQAAREAGIKIDQSAIDDAEQSVARQNQVDVAEMHRRLAADGVELSVFRNHLRDQLMQSRIRDREVDQKVRVSELDIDQYLRERQKNPNDAQTELNIAQVLVALPDAASPAQIAAAQSKAQRILDRARAGDDFAKLAGENSDAAGAAASGGEIGLRPADRYPTLFVDATRSLPVGGLTLIRSGAGFHVLKVIEKHADGMPASTAVQTHASHILLRLSPQLGEAEARARLADFRKRILAGQADFATLAKENSQDGSAAEGGDLGWANPGQFVPEFEEVMSSLAPGQISEPLVSRFGVHLIKVIERRTVQLTQREQREAVRAIVREKKLNDAYALWMQDLRARAYVEMREPPS
jgi:peptidyl-prolyl cis-trans isomerase SurA